MHLIGPQAGLPRGTHLERVMALLTERKSDRKGSQYAGECWDTRKHVETRRFASKQTLSLTCFNLVQFHDSPMPQKRNLPVGQCVFAMDFAHACLGALEILLMGFIKLDILLPCRSLTAFCLLHPQGRGRNHNPPSRLPRPRKPRPGLLQRVLESQTVMTGDMSSSSFPNVYQRATEA